MSPRRLDPDDLAAVLPPGGRVLVGACSGESLLLAEAVQRAGGATGKAELDSLNLAARLADGQQVVVPERVPGAPPGAPAAAGTGGEEDGPISLSTATAAELDTIDGIGPVTAEDIIKFREEHGGLSSVDQLDQISGIGPATMEALSERLQP